MFAFLQSVQRLAGRYLPGTLLRGIVMPVLVSQKTIPNKHHLVETGGSLLIKSNLMMVAAGAVIIAVGGDELIRLLSGSRFDDAGDTLLLLYAGLVVTGQRATIEMVMQVVGYGSVLSATAVFAPLALAAMWVVAPYGLNWAIVVMILASALANGIALMVLSRGRSALEFEWGGQLRIVASALLAAAIGMAVAASGAEPITSGLLAMLAMLAMQPLFRPFTATEIVMVEKALGAGRIVSGMWLLARSSPAGAPVRGTER